ncbi:MAG: OmpA family protein [Chlorobi bacterium]|nr:OmpA family protein [Chlorobiota bacterium]
MHEREDDNRYLISYADMVTLLVGVFVVLSTTFRADADRYRQLARAAASVFGSTNTSDTSVGATLPIEAALAKLSPADIEHDSTTFRCVLADEVLFERGSSRFDASAEHALGELAAALRNGTTTITVDGHTDAVAPRNGMTNIALSVERATAVASALIHNGVPESRVVVRGFGASKPLVADPASPKNRRVEILIALDR